MKNIPTIATTPNPMISIQCHHVVGKLLPLESDDPLDPIGTIGADVGTAVGAVGPTVGACVGDAVGAVGATVG